MEINELKSANELRALQDEARRKNDLGVGVPVAIERFEEIDTLEVSKIV